MSQKFNDRFEKENFGYFALFKKKQGHTGIIIEHAIIAILLSSYYCNIIDPIFF